jgi:hypothetical protein
MSSENKEKKEIIKAFIKLTEENLARCYIGLANVEEKRAWQFEESIQSYTRILSQMEEWYKNPPSDIPVWMLKDSLDNARINKEPDRTRYRTTGNMKGGSTKRKKRKRSRKSKS